VRLVAVAAGAQALGLKVGDVVLAVGTHDVDGLEQFDAAVSTMDEARPLPVTVLRGDLAQFIWIPLVK
jgi:serine protease Do